MTLPRLLFTYCLCLLAFHPATLLRADSGDYLLIQDELRIQHIRLVEIRGDSLVHLKDGLWITVDLNECIAILHTKKKSSRSVEGVLVLTDGQRFPGVPASVFDQTDGELNWNHRWLGRLDIPLDDIQSVVFQPGATVPEPGDGDVLRLVNGDRFDGFIVSLHDPVEIEVDNDGERQLTEVPRSNVASVRMVSRPRKGTSRRVWFDNGTVLDVDTIEVGDDGFVQLNSTWLSTGTKPIPVKLAELDSILLDPDRLLALATLEPSRVEGPASRYTLTRPERLNPDAALNLSAIEFRGPILARYSLPPDCRRFATRATIPPDSRHWADFDLIIRINDDEVFKTRMNSENPSVEINIPLDGVELTIELTEGGHGPIQDHVIFEYPMLLLQRD
ncbi:MAG: hypothetical protein O7G85_02135 [Planctomycetota bacterium]|nr:hypothetical protein [Planctomycetota bacterium]